MGEVVKVLLANSNDKETWSYEARDILLDTWTTLLAVSTIFDFFFKLTYIYNIMHGCVHETLWPYLVLFVLICDCQGIY